jgi:Tfp pilus assembly protein PilW
MQRHHNHGFWKLPRLSTGLTLVELMVAMTISLFVLLALVNVFVNVSRTNDEMARTTSLIENGRATIQILQNDLVHAGYWGGYVSQFDNLTATGIPGDVPTAIPNPCDAVATWNSSTRDALLGIAVQSADTLPTGTGCKSPLTKRAGTDMLVVRHVDNCTPGTANCEADTAGKLYLQTSSCFAEKNAGTVAGSASSSITLGSNASSTNGAYNGLTLRIVSGTGAGQLRAITSYDGGTRVATVTPDWTTTPNNTSTYAFEYVLGTSSFPLHTRTCVGTGSPATLPITSGAPTVATKRKFISNLYYISDVAHPERAGELVPTLMRSKLDLNAGELAHQAPVALLEGVEDLRVELGIDDLSQTGGAVNYTQAIDWQNPTEQKTPKNRGDGSPDTYVRCTTSEPCSAAQLMNVVAVKLYVLARARDITPGYQDQKSYCLGEPDEDGACPTDSQVAAKNDGYKRHVFMTTVRLMNISGRRESP